MMRIALGIEYNGSSYHGWQIQQHAISLQSTLQMALAKVANHPVQIFCAGRTDAGVHATNQVVHFDTTAMRKLDAWIMGVNSYLPKDINVVWVKAVDDSFHARFSALSRHYQYILYNNHVRSSILGPLMTWHQYPLDDRKMQAAALYLMGEHDFSSFRSSACQSRTAKRFIFALHVKRHNDLVVIDIVANSFLHHMVRNIVGVLIEIGEGKKEPDWMKEVLEAKARVAASKTALPQGLYLTGVTYPDIFNLPSHSRSIGLS